MIGERLRKLRQERGYSLTELAKQAEVSKSYLSYLERNIRTNPSLQFLTKIANTLNCSIEYLLGKENIVDEIVGMEDLDQEWVDLIKMIDNGMSKEDLEEFREFIKFKNWKTTKK